MIKLPIVFTVFFVSFSILIGTFSVIKANAEEKDQIEFMKELILKSNHPKAKADPELIKAIKDGKYQEYLNRLLELNKDNESTNAVPNKEVHRTVAYPESEVHAAINPTDSSNIIISPIRPGSSSGLTCPIYYTKDFGETWIESSYLPKPHGFVNPITTGGGDPVIIFDEDGKAYLTWINVFEAAGKNYIATFWAYSNDGGQSWEFQNDSYFYLSEVNQQSGGTFGYMGDKQWLSVDRTNGVNRGNIYMSLTGIYLPEDFSKYGSYIELFSKKSNENNFKKTPTLIAPSKYYNLLGYFELGISLQFSTSSVDHLGNIHLTFYRGNIVGQSIGDYNLYYAKSIDGGATFTVPTPLTRFTLSGSDMMGDDVNDPPVGFGGRFYPCPYNAADHFESSPYKGNIYLTWTADGTNTRQSTKHDIYFMRSIDGGATWSTPKVIHSGYKGTDQEQFYPAISINSKGIIAISYYDQGQSANGFSTDYVVALSYDGGNSFSQPILASTVSSDFRSIGERNGEFGIGEYCQVVMSDNYAIPVWADGRRGGGNIDIYMAKIPLFADVTSVEEIKAIDSDFLIKSLYPSPAISKSELTIESKSNGRMTVTIFDQIGKKLSTINANIIKGTNPITLDLLNLSHGHYFLSCEMNGYYSAKKFLFSK